jgi:uridine phosphorylase
LKVFSLDSLILSVACHSFFTWQTVLGKIIHRPAKLDRKLARELKALADPTEDPYDTVSGKTMCTYDFYEGQGRLDGAFCEFTENDKMEYLEKLRDFGVVNIEMEGE